MTTLFCLIFHHQPRILVTSTFGKPGIFSCDHQKQLCNSALHSITTSEANSVILKLGRSNMCGLQLSEFLSHRFILWGRERLKLYNFRKELEEAGTLTFLFRVLYQQIFLKLSLIHLYGLSTTFIRILLS